MLAPRLQSLIHQEVIMVRAAITFFIIAIFAFLLGLGGVAGISMDIGRTLLIVFLVLAVLSFLYSVMTGKGPRNIA